MVTMKMFTKKKKWTDGVSRFLFTDKDESNNTDAKELTRDNLTDEEMLTAASKINLEAQDK